MSRIDNIKNFASKRDNELEQKKKQSKWLNL